MCSRSDYTSIATTHPRHSHRTAYCVQIQNESPSTSCVLYEYYTENACRVGGMVQVEWHSGTKRQRQEFWTDVVHNACDSLLNDDRTKGEEEFRGHLRRLTRENNVPRKRYVEQR